MGFKRLSVCFSGFNGFILYFYNNESGNQTWCAGGISRASHGGLCWKIMEL